MSSWLVVRWFCILYFTRSIAIHAEYIVNLVNIDQGQLNSKNNMYLEESRLVKCDQLIGVSSGQQKYCHLYQDHMEFVSRAVKASLTECKWQFKNYKWNCTTPDEDNFLGPNFQIGTREAAFMKAIIGASVVYSVSRACKEGQLMTCGCSKALRPRNLQKDWIWGGCSDNMKYGYKFAEGFLDVKEREKHHKRMNKEHARTLANLHNNEAGRRAVSKNSHVTCKCHGVSGSCTLVTCWQQLPTMREVGDYLKAKYHAATKVKVNRRGRLQIKDPTLAVPTVNDLVYVDESPNYCSKNLTAGSFGTQNRLCNRTSFGNDGCDIMCCGRGYNTIRTTVRERCNCKFHWCCHVECNICTKTNQIFFCK